MQNHVRTEMDGILEGIRPFFHQIKCIKPFVFEGTYSNGFRVIIKGALNREVLIKQIELSMCCPSSFVTFIPFVDGDWVKESNAVYWACMEFMPGRSLFYSVKEERQLALEKVAQFHEETTGYQFRNIPTMSLKQKWTNRLLRFTSSVQPELFSAEQNSLLKRYTKIGEAVLLQMNVDDLEKEAFQNGYIVHGDPAHHNFIFHHHSLLLIDGDLAVHAPKEYDYLQMLNRMLPYCSWSLDEWVNNQIPALNYCFTNPSLRRLLAYPADFYREWLMEPSGRNQLLTKTMEQDADRTAFMKLVLQ
ncbi:phosphotransferase [Alkalihalobacillus macyae]|uniref:phosphotransferase n=1 Tax=Guptibacillus hwajinpoensis TaxID=208199 RepID=UPI00273BB20B|nr:phosphotransferase [Alkalihalobacillus macyae]MDP4550434.1 phosphotransferase [Alkalihalobacillus macyae]